MLSRLLRKVPTVKEDFHTIPDEFWRLYSIYVAMVIFSSIVWSIKKSPQQLDQMIERIHVVLDDHKNFDLIRPSWYK